MNNCTDPRDPFVFFDLGNVLVHFDHDVAVRNVAGLVNRQQDLVKETLFGSGLQNRLETGLITSHEFADIALRQLQSQLATYDFLEAISAIFQPNMSILGILRQLKHAAVPMAILSNTCEPHWQWIVKQRWPVMEEWFDFCVLSYEAQSMKPDSRIYEICEAKSGRLPAQLFFTDDRAENVAAAEQRGWKTHHFSAVPPLAQALEQWLGWPLHPQAGSPETGT